MATAAVAALVGCHATTADTATSSDAIAVDFFQGKERSACAGTLLSPNVVLTTAHCAGHSDAARVTIAGTRQTVEVDDVYYYDWTAAPSHLARHDVALLVLRAPLSAPSYAPIAPSDPIVARWMHGIVSAAGKGTTGALHFTDDPAPLVSPEGGDLVTQPPQKFTRRPQILLGDDNYYTAERGPNYWLARPNDPEQDAFTQAPTVAGANANAAYIFTHGTPGWMEGLPPKDEVRTLFQNNGQQLILGSCYGGVDKDGASNAQRLADIIQLPRESVYGCTGFVGNWWTNANCDGQWVDGNGTPLTDEKRQELRLRNCSFSSDVQNGNILISQNDLAAMCH